MNLLSVGCWYEVQQAAAGGDMVNRARWVRGLVVSFSAHLTIRYKYTCKTIASLYSWNTVLKFCLINADYRV